MMLRKKPTIAVTLWTETFVGSLPELSEFLSKNQIVPHVGESVALPPQVSGARSVAEKPDGSTTELTEMQLQHTCGTVTSVFYSAFQNRIEIGVSLSKGDKAT